VNPCARTVAAAALRPCALDGCGVNAGSGAVRVLDASVPPLELGGGVVAVETGAVVVVGAVREGPAGCVGTLAVFALEPHAERAAAHAGSASHPSRRIG